MYEELHERGNIRMQEGKGKRRKERKKQERKGSGRKNKKWMNE